MMMGPVVEEVARAQAGTVAFGKLDVDANSRVPDRYGVRSIPTLLVFRDGRLAGTIVGSRPRKELEREIEKAMG
jgi:thioredoxin 1